MKLLLSFTVFFSAFAFADYGGSAMYPETNCPAKPYTLHIGGVPQTPTYDKVNTLYKVPPADWKAIGSVFNDSLDYWHGEYTNWFDRGVLRIDRVC